MKATSDEFKSIIGYTRRALASQLAKRTVVGAEVPADPEAGRYTRYWVNGNAAQGRPVVVVLHGGGFAIGDARKGDATREWIAQRFDVRAIGVDYRLAPEHPYPDALDDVIEAIRYASRGAFAQDGAPGQGSAPAQGASELETLGQGDAPVVYLVGFSAGANLALSAAIALRDDPSVSIAGLALHYPMVDAADDPVDKDAAVGLPSELMEAFSEAYAAGRDPRDPGISPAFAADEKLVGIAPVAFYPVIGDPLFAQVERFYKRMVGLGCTVAWHPVEGMYHGYIEDAEDVELYRATTMPETIAARPAGFVEAAARELDASLCELLGPAHRDVVFPSLQKGGAA